MSSIITYQEGDRISLENVYLIDGELQFLCTTDPSDRLDNVMISATDYLLDNLTIRTFPDSAALNTYVQSIKPVTITGDTCYASHFYDWNVAHGLYDTLYPLYLCYLWSVIPGGMDRECGDNFNILLRLKHIPGWKFPGHASRDWVLDIFQKFAGGKLITTDAKEQTLQFESMSVGHAAAGIVNVNCDAQMPGKEIRGLERFRDRMLAAYHIIPNHRERSSRPIITLVNSRRYTRSEREALDNVRTHFERDGWCDVKMVDWKDVTSFHEQLSIMQHTDIHVAGAGTTMLNFPFLRDGAHHINLGVVQVDACEMPGLLEVNICLLSNTINMLYYDVFKHKEIQVEPLQQIIERALNGERDGVPWYIRAWRRLCREDPHMEEVLVRMNGLKQPHLMGYRHPEIVINEHSPYEHGTDLIDTDLLRQIKTEMIETTDDDSA